MSTNELFLNDRSKLHPSHAVAALAILPSGNYLLQLRDGKPGIFYPSHWGCFGGALEPSDPSVEDGLIRELTEELAIMVPRSAVSYFTRLSFDFSFCGLGTLDRTYCLVHLSGTDVAGISLGEGSAWRLFSAREALSRPDLVPYDAFAIWMHASRGRLGPTNTSAHNPDADR